MIKSKHQSHIQPWRDAARAKISIQDFTETPAYKKPKKAVYQKASKVVKLLFNLNNLLGQLWHLRDLLSDDDELPLSLLELKVDHPDLFFLLSDLLLSICLDTLNLYQRVGRWKMV